MPNSSRLPVLPDVSNQLLLSILSVALLTLATTIAGIFLFPIVVALLLTSSSVLLVSLLSVPPLWVRKSSA